MKHQHQHSKIVLRQEFVSNLVNEEDTLFLFHWKTRKQKHFRIKMEHHKNASKLKIYMNSKTGQD